MINKIKKAWKNNRVMFVLVVIVVLCIFVIGGVMFKYFFGGNVSNYGDRLDNIKDVPYNDEAKNQLKDALSIEQISQVDIDTRGKIVYVIVYFNTGITLADAQTKIVEIHGTIDEKYLKLYDFNYTLIQNSTEDSAGFRIMGAKNVGSSSFVWSNNTPVPEKSGD